MIDESEHIDELVAQLRAGDDGVLAELFSLYHNRLKRIVQFRLDHRIAGRVSASDVIQDTYLSASKRLGHFRQKSELPLFVWLRLLVNQQLTDLHRQHLQAEMRDARKEVSLEQPAMSPHTSLAIAVQLAGNATSPSRAFARVERIAKLEEAINAMEPIDREVIALRHFEELTNAEAAEILAIGVQAASKRYVRAIKRLREIAMSIPGLSEA